MDEVWEKMMDGEMGILELTAVELGKKIKFGEVGVEEALEAVIERIQEREESLHCYVTLDLEGARAKARLLQKKLLNGEVSGPLAGVPFAVKDNLCTKGMRTTCGSKILKNFVPPYDATVVRNLESAGAFILGKTNLDEFGMGNTTERSFAGATRNPWDEERSAGGSSGGSAAAVASGECFAALGTDTGGSIRQPAAHCGLVGLKPTYGTVSRYGLIAYCSSMDQAGPITKDVRDCAAVMEAIASYDEKDATSLRREPLHLQSALTEGVSGLKIGIPKDYFEEKLQPEVEHAVRAAMKELEAQGAIVEEFELGLVRYAVPTYYTIACAEASSNLERYDGMKYGLREAGTGLHDTYRQTRAKGFGEEVKRRILLGTFALSEGYYEQYYLKAMKARRLIKNRFDEVFQTYDLLLGPAAPTTAPQLGSVGDDPVQAYLADVYTVPANLAGIPAMSLPCGRDAQGMPIGLQLMADRFQERTIFRAAATWEQVFGGFRQLRGSRRIDELGQLGGFGQFGGTRQHESKARWEEGMGQA